MYEIYDTEKREVIGLTDEPRYVYRSPRNGVWIRCKEDEAECVAVDGVRYSIDGKPKVDDAAVVKLRKADAAARIRALAELNIEHAETIEDFKAMFADFADAIIDLYQLPATYRGGGLSIP